MRLLGSGRIPGGRAGVRRWGLYVARGQADLTDGGPDVGAESGQQFGRPKTDLLSDYRHVGLDRRHALAKIGQTARSDGRRDAIGNDPIPGQGRVRPGPAGLPGRTRERFAAAGRRAAPSRAASSLGRAPLIGRLARSCSSFHYPGSGFFGHHLPGPGSPTQFRVDVGRICSRYQGLGQRGNATDEVAAPCRIQFTEHVVKEQQRGPVVEHREQIELGQLEGEDGGPLLSARSECRQVPTGHVEDEVVPMRTDERAPVPDLFLRGLGEAPVSASRGVSPGSRGAFVEYLIVSLPSVGAISRLAASRGAASSSRRRSRAATIPEPAARNGSSQR